VKCFCGVVYTGRSLVHGPGRQTRGHLPVHSKLLVPRGPQIGPSLCAPIPSWQCCLRFRRLLRLSTAWFVPPVQARTFDCDRGSPKVVPPRLTGLIQLLQESGIEHGDHNNGRSHDHPRSAHDDLDATRRLLHSCSRRSGMELRMAGTVLSRRHIKSGR
jgi:hypothetical protein